MDRHTQQTPHAPTPDHASKPENAQNYDNEKAAALALLPVLDVENPSRAFKLRQTYGIPQPVKPPKPKK